MPARRMLRSTATIALGGIAVVGGFIVASLLASPATGAKVAAGALALTILIVFALANSAAQEDFFRAYAEGRSLVRRGEKGKVPPLAAPEGRRALHRGALRRPPARRHRRQPLPLHL